MAEQEPIKPIKYIDVEEFRQAGYLQEVNRCFLHPLGLALEVTTDETGRAVAFSGVWDYRDDPEGMNFGGPLDVGKVDRIADEWDEKARSREQRLGYVVQPVEKAI